jgi:hypothetical protein
VHADQAPPDEPVDPWPQCLSADGCSSNGEQAVPCHIKYMRVPRGLGDGGARSACCFLGVDGVDLRPQRKRACEEKLEYRYRICARRVSPPLKRASQLYSCGLAHDKRADPCQAPTLPSLQVCCLLGVVSVHSTTHCSLGHCASSQAAPPFTGISRAVVAFHVHLGTFSCVGECTRPCSGLQGATP